MYFLFLLLLITTCSQRKDSLMMLKPLAVYDVNIPETSDLCFGSNADILYTVSDNTAKVYKITTKGEIQSQLKYKGSDLEGVCNVDNQFIYIAEERLRKIIKLDLQGNIIDQKTIPVKNNEENSGLEGIAYATFNNHFYILNEMNPGVLIETDSNLNVLNNYSLSFARDYSGICVDNINNNLWIVSDMNSSVNKCNMKGEIIESYKIPVKNAEGIAFDPISKDLYIISDSEEKLYRFNLSSK